MYHAPELFNAISIAALQRISSHPVPEVLVRTLDAFVKMNIPAPDLLGAAAHAMARHYDSFSTKDIANTVRRCAHVGVSATALMHQIFKHIHDYIDIFSLVDIESFDIPIMWQLTANIIGKLGPKDPSLPAIIATVEAYSAHGVTNPEFYDALATASTDGLDAYSPEQVTRLVQAFSNAGISHKFLFDRVATTTIARIHQFGPEELKTLAGSYSTACMVAPALFEAVSTTAPTFDGHLQQHC